MFIFSLCVHSAVWHLRTRIISRHSASNRLFCSIKCLLTQKTQPESNTEAWKAQTLHRVYDAQEICMTTFLRFPRRYVLWYEDVRGRRHAFRVSCNVARQSSVTDKVIRYWIRPGSVMKMKRCMIACLSKDKARVHAMFGGVRAVVTKQTRQTCSKALVKLSYIWHVIISRVFLQKKSWQHQTSKKMLCVIWITSHDRSWRHTISQYVKWKRPTMENGAMVVLKSSKISYCSGNVIFFIKSVWISSYKSHFLYTESFPSVKLCRYCDEHHLWIQQFNMFY